MLFLLISFHNFSLKFRFPLKTQVFSGQSLQNVSNYRVVQVKFAIFAFDWCRYKLRPFDWGRNLLRPSRSWYINKISLALHSQRRRASSSFWARHIRHKRLVLAWMSLISIHSRLLFVNHSPKSQQFRDTFVISSSPMFGLLRQVGNPKSRRGAIKGWKCQVLAWRGSKSLVFSGRNVVMSGPVTRSPARCTCNAQRYDVNHDAG